jgi:alkanesulfonate monooxygenase SsuD/methylene tetrahydromethanopterin reductase-like flavin-dependent oxidoreductase (luciferase family)
VAAAWLAAHTRSLAIGHLVLCDAVRHPAVLAKEAVALDQGSRGRFELGIGWGSNQAELDAVGLGPTTPSERVARLRESIEVMRLLWSGALFDYNGRHHRLQAVVGNPVPSRHIPVVVGGAGSMTLELAADLADWWNCPATRVRDLATLMPRVAPARISIHQPVALTGTSKADSDKGVRRFTKLIGAGVAIVGDVPLVAGRLRQLADSGVERAYVWLPDTTEAELMAFGDVINRL